tara:strand:+ start:564 stop:1115 length:552 start_codon:yes stop_codon:yes gene_type:complete
MKKKGFQLRSGNRPSFYKMSGASPFKEDNNSNGNGNNTESNTEEEEEKTNQQDTENKKEDETKTNLPPDKPGTKAWKIAANALIGGFDAVYGTKTKRPQINWPKNDEEVDADSPEQRIQKYKEEFSTSSPAPETDPDGNMIYPDDPKHSMHKEYMKHNYGELGGANNENNPEFENENQNKNQG